MLNDPERNAAMLAVIASLPDHRLTGEEANHAVNSMVNAVLKYRASLFDLRSKEVKDMAKALGLGPSKSRWPVKLIFDLIEDKRAMSPEQFATHFEKFKKPTSTRGRMAWIIKYDGLV